jgi:hypothetical protein
MGKGCFSYAGYFIILRRSVYTILPGDKNGESRGKLRGITPEANKIPGKEQDIL